MYCINSYMNGINDSTYFCFIYPYMFVNGCVDVVAFIQSFRYNELI